jgi:hypothetical protein
MAPVTWTLLALLMALPAGFQLEIAGVDFGRGLLPTQIAPGFPYPELLVTKDEDGMKKMCTNLQIRYTLPRIAHQHVFSMLVLRS